VSRQYNASAGEFISRSARQRRYSRPGNGDLIYITSQEFSYIFSKIFLSFSQVSSQQLWVWMRRYFVFFRGLFFRRITATPVCLLRFLKSHFFPIFFVSLIYELSKIRSQISILSSHGLQLLTPAVRAYLDVFFL